MEYYTLLQLKGEPFSNSPDPDYFFQSRQHHTCLQKLELAVRLKRGLNVIMGDVGSGKTTMCREIIRKFAQEPEIETHLLLDPALPSAEAFLRLFQAMLCGQKPDAAASELQLKEQIKQTLFEKGVAQNKTVVLIIDEGQKITSACVEVVRELLNYETNQFKLLQIIIFAQSEFDSVLKEHANFADRVNLLHHLGPMSFADTRRMIYHRLKLVSRTAKPRDMFTLPALWAIYRFSRGYPRKIIHLCHQSMLTMIIQNRTRAGWWLIRSCRKRLSTPPRRSSWRGAWITAGVLLLIASGITVLWTERAAIEADRVDMPNMNVPESALDTPSASPAQANMEGQLPANIEEKKAAADAVASADKAGEPSQIAASGSETKIELLPPLPPAPVPTVAPEPQTAPAQTDQIPPAQPTAGPPATLGDLVVRPGDTFLDLVRLVYGTNTGDFMQAVVEANPHIGNPNTIYLGDVISFPAMAIPSKIDLQKEFRVVLERQPTLATALARLETMRQTFHMDIRLAPHWSPSEGLEFDLVSSRNFTDLQESQAWMARLPEELKSKARLLTGWPHDTTLYAVLPSYTE